MLPNQKLESLRKEMSVHQVDAYIIPSTDPHQSEYVAEYWQSRKWISGFTGSAGTVGVLADEAGLWTDSRYYLQAEQELQGTGISMFKMPNQFEPLYLNYIISKLTKGQTVAVDGQVWSQSACENMSEMCQKAGLLFRQDLDLIANIRHDRPSLSDSMIFIHDTKYTGSSAAQKIEIIREKLRSEKVDYHLITALDDIAWTFNIRGNDVDYNPVAVAFAIVGLHEANLFIQPSKVGYEAGQYLKDNGIQIFPYEEIGLFLTHLSPETSVLVDPTICSAAIYQTIKVNIKNGASIPKKEKAIKNVTEAGHIRHAMAKDGAALANTFYWLENIVSKETITEYQVLEKLAHFRSQQELYISESFGAIIGYKGNGAIIHYAPPVDGSASIHPDGILLVDSGGQYLDGTTDITRTFSLNDPEPEAKKHYTLILKGLIALSRAKFPEGTPGGQLDTLARQYLWEHGLQYLHGTGHGVGFFLNVHEPPQGFAPITSERGRTVIEPGMLTSNEPGYYIAEKYGMRLENLILCVTSDIPGFLEFETVTLYPFAHNLIEERLLTPSDISWINDYHRLVWEKVSPLLSGDVKTWFEDQCKTLTWKD